jgi:hypothetical protein
MLHKSNNPNILWHVDTIHYGTTNIVKGWMLHTSKIIKNIKIGETDLQYKASTREDVRDVYTNAFSIVGFELVIPDELIDSKLDIHLLNGDIQQIESVRKFFVFYSGFQTCTKNLIVVDNFYYKPDMIRDYAINNLKFKESDYHRGKRSEDKFILNGTKEKLEEILGRKIVNWNYEYYANGVFQYCTSYDPIVYHVDSQQFAGVVFLTPDAPLDSGTATYRSKLTGKTRLDGDDAAYQQTFKGVSNEMNFYDSTSYEIVDKVSNVYNRLVMWDAKAIHAATNYFGDSIENARFFQLFFFDVE